MILKKILPAALFFVPVICSLTIKETPAMTYEPVTTQVEVSCGTCVGGDDMYTVHITPASADMPVAEPAMLDIRGGDTGTFSLTVSEPGSYVYHIVSEIGDDPDTEYDKTEYDLILFAENSADDGLSCAVVLQGDDIAKFEGLTFENRCISEGGLSGETTAESQSEDEVTPSEEVSTETQPESETETETESEETTKEETDTSGDGWFSGDNAPVKIIAIIAAVSFVILVCLLVTKVKKEEDNE